MPAAARPIVHPPKGRYGAVLGRLRKHHNGGLGTYSGRLHHSRIDNGSQGALPPRRGSQTKEQAEASEKSR
jgi:hypothetical protein